MKQNYTKLMALACMFLLAGVNAFAADGWNAYNSYNTTDGGSTKDAINVTVTNSYAALPNSKTTEFSTCLIKANSTITYNRVGSTTTTKVGLKVEGSNKLFLKPVSDGYLNIRLACESGYPLTVTFHDNTTNQDVASLYVETATVTNTYRGETVLFEVEANHEYVLNASDGRTYYFVVITKIESNEVVELDEEMSASEIQTAIAGGTYYVTKIYRKLTAGIWNTFCFPQRLGINAVAAALKSETPYEMTSYNSTDKTITFTASDRIDPNKPYLIKPSEDVSVITVFNSTPAAYNPQTVTSNGLSFVAALGATNIYTTGDANSTKLFLNKNNKLVYPTSNEGNRGMIKGFRAYFEIPSGGLVKDFVFDDSDDPTGIIRVEQDIFNENGRIYSVDGRYVGNSKENLSRGIYVQNGRKFIVK